MIFSRASLRVNALRAAVIWIGLGEDRIEAEWPSASGALVDRCSAWNTSAVV